MYTVTIEIDSRLVKSLVASQFPQWQDLAVKPVTVQGWDNRTFQLGDEMLVRMPSAERYALKVSIEQRWLPKLASHLPLAIPTPLAIGRPEQHYPWHWSIYRWIKGENASLAHIDDQNIFAADLGNFLNHLHKIDITDGPEPGTHNFYRGSNLAVYDNETQQAITILDKKINTAKALEIWHEALQTNWHKAPVWVHGDISAGNLLIDKGRLCAVIDFGGLAVGDPACDLVIMWTLLRSTGQQVFKSKLDLDKATWARARGWALWKALIVVAGLSQTNPIETNKSQCVLDQLLN